MNTKEFGRLKKYLLSVSADSPDAILSVLGALRPWFEVAAGERPVLRPINSVDHSSTAYALGVALGREADCLREISARNEIGISTLTGLKPLSGELGRDLASLRRKLGAGRWSELTAQISACFAADLDGQFRDEYHLMLGDEVWTMARDSLLACIHGACGWAVAGDAAGTDRYLLLLRAMRGEIILGEMPGQPGWWVLIAA